MHACQPALSLRFAIAAALRRAALGALLGTAVQAWAAADPRLLEAARAAEPALMASLQEMVSIESGSRDPEGLARMADYAEKRLAALGATTERIAPTHGGSPIVKATLRGDGKGSVMLIAHMDTVYPRGTLATQPLRREGNRLYGPGIADNKGGIAVILHALDILQRMGWRDYARITVLLNADEEIGSEGSGDIIAALGADHDAVLSCEPTAAKAVVQREALLLGASGTATATLEVKGRASHAGAAPEHGRNALLELAYQLQQTRDIASTVPGTQLNWTTANAGGVRNQIPDRAVATADVRTTVKDGPDKLKAALEAKVSSGRLIPDTESTIAMEVGRPPFVINERGRALARRAQQIYAELDGRPLALREGTGGGTDAGYAALSGKPAVVESFGLAGFGYHARDEYIEVDSIVPRLYLMTRVLQELGSGRAPRE